MNQKAERYPVDFDTLDKGQSFTVEELERILDTPRTSQYFQLRVLGLQTQIERELEDRGKHITVAQQRRNLCLLTDSQATGYHDKGTKGDLRSYARHCKKLALIDREQLTDAERKHLERLLYVHSRLSQIINATRRKLQAEVCKRKTPPMLQGTNGEK